MVNQIEIAIANKVDGIITMPIAPEAMRPAFVKCAEAGIPVVFVGAEDDQSEALAFIGTNEAELGRIGAEAIMEKMAGAPIKAHILQSTMDASFAIKARDGYLAAFENYEGEFELVVNEACNSDMMIAMEKYQNALAANPEINVIIGVCGEAGPAAAKVVKEQGLSDILIVAIDDTQECMDFVQEGVIWGTMAQNFYKMGYLGSQFLVDFIKEGKTPESFKNDSGSVFVTKENFETYAESLKD
jgi:ribose transport system substrate-binding protein